MQMALVIVGGFVVATSPPVVALTRKLAAIPKSARGAVAFVAAFAMLSSLISWGLSLIFTTQFWMLPLLGILNVRARDLAGYSILQPLFHAPVVLLLCWLFSSP